MKLVDLKCPKCGGKLQVSEASTKTTCPYCDEQFVIDDEVQHVRYDNMEEAGYQYEKGKQKAQNEIVETHENGLVCARCGSRDIKFTREKIGTQYSGKSNRTGFRWGRRLSSSGSHRGASQHYYNTVALCKNCGNTWNPNAIIRKKGTSFWTILLWIFFFPIMFTLWAIKTEKFNKQTKIVLISIVWIVFLLLGIFGKDGEQTDNSAVTQSPETSAASIG
jgi:predicted RNA-binding Zn-ribbon protein involved in translation (DUF1610 family)